ncbi:transglycosylase SLT domain-containing protein [Halomonas campisalis]|uniref:Transglycosylase SLT domain-containing protein n=1 Tax=Billgrantia campisalis TaxID=74661 RepID=A0ABS9P5Z0_9GAMM|nr:transglycosylase SLT domain-containing protein [Halomonas campisalis]MCG6657174.1 transglycosylase SLT domain-containing protein [Halomonas campisalis]MDR5862359.1 transglycosylase SLT domain-containing protein [Halomonas campisalis]
MTYRTARGRAIGLASSIALIGALVIAGSASQAATPTTALPIQEHHFWDALELKPSPGDTWARLRDNLAWQERAHDERVQRWIEHYRANPHNVVEITERARPWMAWIIAQVEARGLPGEIALIPFVESSFDPKARSHRGAAGLWQFMPGTGDALGLRRQRGYDGRLDVVAATRAALDYIELQAEQWYEGDLELSLAAYNAGAGTVNRARHAAGSRGEPTDYWHLRLPNETMQYVPKLHAIAAIIAEPEAHGVELPDIEDTPAFAKIPVDRPLDLGQLASQAGVSRSELAALNPALSNGSAHPSTSEVVLVPAEYEEVVLARLNTPTTEPSPGGAEQHLVQRGDSLSSIASRYGISVAELRQHNGLNGDVIQEGETLEVPRRSLASR